LVNSILNKSCTLKPFGSFANRMFTSHIHMSMSDTLAPADGGKSTLASA
jgi:hypothetical protein